MRALANCQIYNILSTKNLSTWIWYHQCVKLTQNCWTSWCHPFISVGSFSILYAASSLNWSMHVFEWKFNAVMSMTWFPKKWIANKLHFKRCGICALSQNHNKYFGVKSNYIYIYYSCSSNLVWELGDRRKFWCFQHWMWFILHIGTEFDSFIESAQPSHCTPWLHVILI